jgi:hypothetical protein
MDSVYIAPPNWPPPPAGWTPPPGWTPDPGWPEPPPNWQFWVPGSAAVPARRKGRLWLLIGLPVALAVVAVVMLGVGIIAAFSGIEGTVKPAQSAASSYLQALQDQRYEAASAMRCSADLNSQDSFVQHWKSQSSSGHGLAAFTIVGVNVQTYNGRSSAQAQLDLQYADGYRESQRLPLTKTGSTWQPCP